MKKAFSFTLPVLALFVIASITQSCKKIKDQVYILEMTDLMFTTNPQNTTGPLVLVDTVIAAGLVQYMEDNGLSIDHVKSVKLKTFTLKTDPTFSPDANFNGFSSGSAYMKAGSLSEQLFATKSPVPDNLKELNFDSNGSQLKEYLSNDELQIILRGENDANLPETTYLMDMIFEVTYDIL